MPIGDENPKGSDEPTLIMGESGGEAASTPGPSAPPEEPVRSSAPTPPPSDATVIGKSASAMEVPEQKAPPKPSDTQDTVVSPRLRQLAQTPGQPLRPPPAGASRSLASKLPVIGSTPPRLYMLVGLVAVLVLMMVILIGVLVARNGPTLLSGLTSTRTPTPTATRPATATLPPRKSVV